MRDAHPQVASQTRQNVVNAGRLGTTRTEESVLNNTSKQLHALALRTIAMNRLAFTLAISLTMFAPTSSLAQLVQTETYNNRHDYSRTLPQGMFIHDRTFANGMGEKFKSPVGDASIVTFAEPRHGVRLTSAYRQALKTYTHGNCRVTYTAWSNNWFVVSGYAGNKVFYHKTIASPNMFKMFTMRYPKGERSVYDAVVASLSTTFNDRNTSTSRTIAQTGNVLF